MAFCEVQMPVGISYGAVGGPIYSSIVITAASGNEQRIAQWSNGRRKWNVAHALRTLDQRDDLIAFFIARRGMFEGFRFKDWSDFNVFLTSPEDMVLITSTTFQLVKRYISGGETIVRNIVKPVSGTLQVWNGPTQITVGFTVDYTTGIVTFGAAPGYLPAASFQFDVPARFNTDEMDWSQDQVSYGSWNSVDVIEIIGET